MKIIDAHIHYTSNEYFEETARASGSHNSFAFLEKAFKKNNIVMGIGMGNVQQEDNPGLPALFNLDQPMDPFSYNYPDFTSYCAGISANGLTKARAKAVLPEYEKLLKTPRCVGLKAYIGYHECYIYDELYHPFFELAGDYDVPVVIHTGDTAGGKGKIKYAHPLTVDEVATMFPQTKIVMAHCGNPWIVDAIQVASKNENVYIDLSGMLAGNFDLKTFYEEQSGYVEHLKTWTRYMGRYDKLLYGSDWPLPNIEKYIDFISTVIPANQHTNVFYNNAYHLFKKVRNLI